MKKLLSGLTALILLLSVCAGCGQGGGDTPADEPPIPATDGQEEVRSIFTTLTDLDMREAVLEMDGNSIPADIYLYYLVNTANSLEYQLSMSAAVYGMYTEVLDEEGQVKWDQSVEGVPLTDMVREQTENAALSYVLLENVAKEHNITVSDEERTALEEQLAEQIAQSGGEEAFQQSLYEMGLTLDSLNRLRTTDSLYQHLLELAQDPSSDLYEAPSDDNAYVDHILLTTANTETNEPLSDEEIAEKKAKAEELLAQLQASSELEQLFTDMADTYGEDPGRASGKGYLIDPSTNFVQEFKDAAFALKPGEISGIVESDYGYHILLRKDLTQEHLAQLAEQRLQSYLNDRMAAALENVVRSEKLSGIDAGVFYTSYVDALSALHPAEDADAGDSGNTDDGGSADTGDGADGSSDSATE